MLPFWLSETSIAQIKKWWHYYSNLNKLTREMNKADEAVFEEHKKEFEKFKIPASKIK